MKDTIVLHHTANPSAKDQLSGVINLHLHKFGQRGAYHYFIEASGFVTQLHDESFVAYHSGKWVVNLRSIGICLAGDFTKHEPTEAQILSLTLLISEIQHRWGIPDVNIKLHREIKQTACPGVDLRQLAFNKRKKLIDGSALRIKRKEQIKKKKNRLTTVFSGVLKAFS